MDHRKDGREETEYRISGQGKAGAAARRRARRVVGLQGAEYRLGVILAGVIHHAPQGMQVALEAESQCRVVPLRVGLAFGVEVFFEESKGGVDLSGLLPDVPNQGFREGMPHVDHRAVDPVFLLVGGDHLREVVPQGAHRVFLLGQSGVVVPEGVVRHVVVLVFRIAVHAQVGYVVPRRLNVVRWPVGKSGGDDGFAFGSLPYRLPFEAFYLSFGRRESEHLAIVRAGGEVVFLLTRGRNLPDAPEFFGGKMGLFKAVGILTVDPVEPLGVRGGLDAIHRSGPQGKFQHDADAQDVGGFHQGGELVGDAHPFQQRIGQQRVEVHQVGGGVR